MHLLRRGAWENWEGTIGYDSSAVTIGGLQQQGGLNWFHGAIDELRIYNRALSTNEILQTFIDGIEAPAITVSPQTQTIGSGSGVTFSVTATGGPLYYQWRFNGTNMAGATGSSLYISAARATNAGFYDVVVYNFLGTNTSAAARLALFDLKMLAALYLTGPIGSQYRIDCRPVVGPTNWTTLTNITLPTQPYIYVDYDSATLPRRFYQAVPLP